MKEDEKSPSRRIAESKAEGCVCPECGKDVGWQDIARRTHQDLGETHWYPGCNDCGIYCNSWNNDHWYPERE